MAVALDTNVLIYAEGLNDPKRQGEAKRAVAQHHLRDVYIPAQVLAEFFFVQVRKFKVSVVVARHNLDRWVDACPVVPTTSDVLLASTELVRRHHFAFWDAIVLASAAEAECELLLSEDFQDGFTWRGVTISNPFTPA